MKSFEIVKFDEDFCEFREDSFEEFSEENDLDDIEYGLETKDIPGNSVLMCLTPDFGIDSILRFKSKKSVTVSCQGFGEGISSDHWLLFTTKEGDCISLYNEPYGIDLKNLDEEFEDQGLDEDEIEELKQTIKKYKVDYLFVVN